MSETYGIIDLFAGPGGLGEGFASLTEQARHPFRIGISVEKERSAHDTLRLRAFLREFTRKHDRLPAEYIEFHAGNCAEPDWRRVDAQAWKEACREAQCLELGHPDAARAIDDAIDRVRSEHRETILIGGPPCQAYSLVGRARSRGNWDYRPEADQRHFLFREYIRVLDKHRPAAFVMENVKGLLSSTVESRLVFEMLMEDLSSLGTGGRSLYKLRAIAVEDDRLRLREASRPADFIVRAEHLGVPQKRHRVIIIGLRSDIAPRSSDAWTPAGAPAATVDDAIGNMAALRSGLSPARDDNADAWRIAVGAAARGLIRTSVSKQHGLSDAFRALESTMGAGTGLQRKSTALPDGYGRSNIPLRAWLENPELVAIAQHETRGHMKGDLARYLFAASFGRMMKRSPKAWEFPLELAPNHRNWESGKFADRFRVQIAGEPATTVTSHISKDGHYFIHPDPEQCRSLTVREAARLQTFPDDYLFLGNRTQQYVQVGNAVPPYLARQIAQLLLRVLSSARSDAVPPSAGELESVS